MDTFSDAAVILIGNELLSGRVADENLGHIARELRALGIPLQEALVVRDEVEPIAEAVRWLSGRRDCVFTSGGVGPTHDDVTVDGVALAFGVGVTLSAELEGAIRARWGDGITEGHLRMARVPEGSSLVAGADGVWPTVRMENVFLLPGVPSILQRKLERLKPDLVPGRPFRRHEVTFVTEEAAIADALAGLAEAHPEVEIGSYPARGTVKVTLEARDPRELAAARSDLDRRLAHVPTRADSDGSV